MSKRVLKVGLIGGGGGAFIVNPHQKAIHMDGTRRVVCGALHQDPKVAMSEARKWPYPIQGYPSYDAMIKDQASKPIGERIDYAVIVTPNFVHYDPAMKLIKAGIPVFCEKPLTITAKQAENLAAGRPRTWPPPSRRPRCRSAWPTRTWATGPVGCAGGLSRAANWARSAGSTPTTSRAGWPPASRRRASSRPSGARTRRWPAPRAAAATSARTPLCRCAS